MPRHPIRLLDGFEQRTEAVTGLEAAATIWESVLADPINVTIDVVALPVIELGFAEAITFHSSHVPTYAEVHQSLVDDAQSVDDFLAVAQLPSGPSLTYRTSDPFGNIVISSGEDAINGYLDVPRANAKALGFSVAAEPGVSDAEIQLNQFFLNADWYDFDRSDGIEGTDFVGAMLRGSATRIRFQERRERDRLLHVAWWSRCAEDLNEYAIWNVLDYFAIPTQAYLNWTWRWVAIHIFPSTAVPRAWPAWLPDSSTATGNKQVTGRTIRV